MTTAYDFKSDAQRTAEAFVLSEGQRLEGIYDMLATEGGKHDQPHTEVQTHNGRQVLVPNGMSDSQAAQILARKAEAEQEEFVHVGRYKYKPWDGAVALKTVLTDLFGAAVTQAKGSNGVIEVPIDAYGNSITVPWGVIELQWRNKKIQIVLDSYQDEEYGQCFEALFIGIELYKYELIGLSKRVTRQLQENSIYKGKSISFSKKRSMPDFVDPYVTKKDRVAYSRDVFAAIEASIFGPIRTAQVHRDAGEKFANNVLLEGDYGTGKTLTLNLTAQAANDAGFTYIQTKAGEDNLEEVKAFAKLYAPSVIGIEDADHLVDLINDPQGKKLSAVLEAFDSASGKGAEISIVMTTNHWADFPAPMRRASRIDTVVHFGAWDEFAFERGVQGHFRPEEIGDVDWKAVAEAMDQFTPAFIISCLSKTRSASIVRTGMAFQPLTTDDFLTVARQVRSHFEEFEESKNFEKKDAYYEQQKSFHKEAAQEALAELITENRIKIPEIGARLALVDA